MNERRTVCIDIDGILTKETENYGCEVYLSRTPNYRNITRVRELFERGDKIILFSSRHFEDRECTEQWLKRYNIPYHKLILGKPHADVYIDDRACNMLEKEILCVSGGVDSTIAWFYLNEPQPLYCKLGHRYEKKELECLKNLERKIPEFKPIYANNLKLGNWEYGENAYIPMRNLFLAMNAVLHGGTKIYIVGVKGDKVEDKSPEAFQVMSFTLNFIRKPIEERVSIESPFWNLTKSDIVKWFINKKGKDFAKDILYTSVSCYDDEINGQCGRCPACFRKFIALEVSGIECLDLFENNILQWEGIEGYKKRLRSGYYDPQRSNEIKRVLMKYNLW